MHRQVLFNSDCNSLLWRKLQLLYTTYYFLLVVTKCNCHDSRQKNIQTPPKNTTPAMPHHKKKIYRVKTTMTTPSHISTDKKYSTHPFHWKMISIDATLSPWVLWKFPGSNSYYVGADPKLYTSTSVIWKNTTTDQQYNEIGWNKNELDWVSMQVDVIYINR